MNAPEAGTIKEYLVNEEDTVTVGQDLVKMDLGGEPQSGHQEKATSEPKSPASDAQETSSDPESSTDKLDPKLGQASPTPEKKEDAPKQVAPNTETPKQDTTKQQSKSSPAKQDAPSTIPSPSKSQDGKGASSGAPFGNREERRVIATYSIRCDR